MITNEDIPAEIGNGTEPTATIVTGRFVPGPLSVSSTDTFVSFFENKNVRKILGMVVVMSALVLAIVDTIRQITHNLSPPVCINTTQ